VLVVQEVARRTRDKELRVSTESLEKKIKIEQIKVNQKKGKQRKGK
jgi:hypothetical protein